ncbi:MAG: NAD-glutamate dehydrogenase [Thermodesulfobacteriota bacterium]|nr:NAD-glutamate dehydrogenase [Thermodesulfobacteriota bacterium]
MSLVEDVTIFRKIQGELKKQGQKAMENLDWLCVNIHPYFFITMKEQTDAIVNLAYRLHDVNHERKITLTDRGKMLTVACLDIPGSLYGTLKTLQEREISYAELTHSYESLPKTDKQLEIQRFEFDRKSHDEITDRGEAKVSKETRKAVLGAMKRLYPDFNLKKLDEYLCLLWCNNESYVRISPSDRIARVLWLYEQGKRHDGLYLDVERAEYIGHHKESRLLFSVGNPPQKGFMTQVSEVFQRLDIGVRRSYSLIINTGIHPYFLGTFYVTPGDGEFMEKDSDLFQRLQTELYNTQILSFFSNTYTDFVSKQMMTGEEASLTNAFIEFCHTSLAHTHPDRFALETVKSAFHSHLHIVLMLIKAFQKRFDPDTHDRECAYGKAINEAQKAIDIYNTGYRYLDEIRKTIFRTCISFIRHTVKTNFFVPEKHALSFRLNPAYLSELSPEFTSDLPQETPFRITFLYSRYGVGYHIGFSDIARGGWRTIICKNPDEYITNTNSLFREVFVLAHTQHLKNKDIYEGGSKLTVVLDAQDCKSKDSVTQRLYKLQYAFINAFLDIFVTEGGKAKNQRVIDYYKEDEPIELGPDENMHDLMIEHIARQSVKREYILGTGIISSKHAGIKHKEYGVTSRGVIKFAEIGMRELSVDMYRDIFTVKITGGTNGDVAGNCIRFLIERFPKVKIKCIVAGSGALYDPEGADTEELLRLVLKRDVIDFNPDMLHGGGFILFRKERKQEGSRELYMKVSRTPSNIEESWVTEDELNSQLDDLIFSVPVDLFLPCGGRPETIDINNWQRLFQNNSVPTSRIIIEGANSYITPEAREEIQRRGMVVLRDASANKCGVISSSYEIIANLFMTEKEFFSNKDAYVKDVLNILDKRAEDEANLIFMRYRKNEGRLLYTQISHSISKEINDHYTKLFAFFQERPDLMNQSPFKRVLLDHLPAFIRDNPRYRTRVKRLPQKIKSAIMASEIASLIVYRGGWDADFESRLTGYLRSLKFNSA